jgi:hypothetical protein
MQGGVLVKGGDKDGRKELEGGILRETIFFLWERAERGCEIGVLRLRHKICWL